MLHKLFVLFLFITLSGCALSVVKPQVSVVSEPAIGVTFTKGIGEAVLTAADVETMPYIEVLKTSEGLVYLGKYAIVGVERDKYEIYKAMPDTGAFIRACDTCVEYNMCLIYEVASNKLWRGSWKGVLVSQTMGQVSQNDFRRVETAVGGIKKTFTYTGKVGSSVKFLYREYSGDMKTPSNNIEVSYDLNATNEIIFKEAKLKVIEANASSITYIVEKGFDPEARR